MIATTLNEKMVEKTFSLIQDLSKSKDKKLILEIKEDILGCICILKKSGYDFISKNKDTVNKIINSTKAQEVEFRDEIVNVMYALPKECTYKQKKPKSLSRFFKEREIPDKIILGQELGNESFYLQFSGFY